MLCFRATWRQGTVISCAGLMHTHPLEFVLDWYLGTRASLFTLVPIAVYICQSQRCRIHGCLAAPCPSGYLWASLTWNRKNRDISLAVVPEQRTQDTGPWPHIPSAMGEHRVVFCGRCRNPVCAYTDSFLTVWLRTRRVSFALVLKL